MQIEFISPFLAATMKVLKTMSNTEAKPGRPHKKEQELQNRAVTAIIDITGGTNASIGITFTESCIVGVVNNMLAETYTGMNDDIADAVGELVNMISGEARRVLAEKGFVFYGGRPVLIKGENHEIKHNVSGVPVVIPFKTDGGIFQVEACFESQTYFAESQNAQKHAEVHENNSSVITVDLQSFMGKNMPTFKGFQLKPNSQQMKSNFFLIAEYTGPQPNNEFCNFTSLEVSVCPETFFATNHLQFFKFGKNVVHSLLENKDLQTKVVPILQEMKDKGIVLPSNMYTVSRSVENAILAYHLAIRTSETLYHYDNDQFIGELSNIGEYCLKAALLSKLEKSLAREKEFLEMAVENYRKTIKIIKGEQLFRHCFRLIAILMYLEQYNSAKEATAFMVKYFQSNAASISPEDAPRIKSYFSLAEKINKEKDSFSITKMKDRTNYLF